MHPHGLRISRQACKLYVQVHVHTAVQRAPGASHVGASWCHTCDVRAGVCTAPHHTRGQSRRVSMVQNRRGHIPGTRPRRTCRTQSQGTRPHIVRKLAQPSGMAHTCSVAVVAQSDVTMLLRIPSCEWQGECPMVLSPPSREALPPNSCDHIPGCSEIH